MILLVASAWADDVTVCDLGCDYTSVNLAFLGLEPVAGPHTINVSDDVVFNTSVTLMRDYTVVAAGSETLTVTTFGSVQVSADRSFAVDGFQIAFSGPRSGPVFQVEGTLELRELTVGDVNMDLDGGLVTVAPGGSATLEDVALAPPTAAAFGDGSAFLVEGQLVLTGCAFDGLGFGNGTLFEVDGGVVQATDLSVRTAISTDRGVLGFVQNGGSLSLQGGVLGDPAGTAATLVGEKNGGLFRVESASLSLTDVGVHGAQGDVGGIVWGSNADIDFLDVTLDRIEGLTGSAVVALEGGTFDWTGGQATNLTSLLGGAVRVVAGTATLTAVDFDRVDSPDGASIASADGPLTLDAVTITDSDHATAAVVARDLLTLQHVVFSGGVGDEAGHVWVDGGELIATSSTFAGGDCLSPTTRGASSVLITGGTGSIEGSTFIGNGQTGSVCDGALAFEGTLTLSGVTFEDNAHDNVGAVEVGIDSELLQGVLPNTFLTNEGSDAALNGRTGAVLGTTGAPFRGVFTGNTGGAVRFGDDTAVHLAASSFIDNDARGSAGGAIYVGGGGALHVDTCDFTTNQADANGGAIAFESGGDATITASTFTGNSSLTHAGAVFSSGTAVVDGSTFSGNTSGGVGGGLRCVGACTVSGGMFVGNQASTGGGALHGAADSTIVVTGTQFDGNIASNGAAINVNDDVQLELRGVRFTDNQASNRAAVFGTAGSELLLEDTLFCGNTAGSDPSGLYLADAAGASVVHTVFARESQALWFNDVRGDVAIEQSNFVGGGLRINDGNQTVEVLVQRSLFADFAPGDPVVLADFDGSDTVVFRDSLLGDAYTLPSPNVETTGLQATDPAILPGPSDCTDALLVDFVAGPVSPAWTRLDPLDHWGAFLPAWGANGDGDPSPALWDCADGDFDQNAAVHREAPEDCGTGTGNGIDDDCDGLVDEGCAQAWYPDGDGDGFGDPGGVASDVFIAGYVQDDSDCDDADDLVYPGAHERCNGRDDDCDVEVDEGLQLEPGVVDADGDQHGVAAEVCPGTSLALPADDCDDADPSIFPGAPELCGNGVDEDCSGEADDPRAWFADVDGDGFGDPDTGVLVCEAPPNTVADDTDCDDAETTINPVATEICNSLDDDCNDAVDDGLPFIAYYPDDDGDGFAADTASVIEDCVQPAGHVEVRGDCDDADDSSHPGAPELCDDVDHDCDGAADPAVVPTWYPDGDQDGFGAGAGVQDCVQPAGSVPVGGDCDDADGTVFPGATEICNAVDDDCAGGIDDGLVVSDWFVDGDGDGYGSGVPIQTCDGLQGPNRVIVAGDCDDQAPGISPSAPERCDQIDNDCDGFVDTADDDVQDAVVYYIGDADQDGWGVTMTAPQCTQPQGTVRNGPDCDDGDDRVHPDAPEICIDGLDNDCDGLVDQADPDFEGHPQPLWLDADGDGYGDAGSQINSCGAAGYIVPGIEDCDDARSEVNPAAAEVCDGLDNNCNGHADDQDVDTPPVDGIPTYTDGDGDGYGGALRLQRICDPASVPQLTSLGGGDCADGDPDVNPGAVEDCSDVDLDCSGSPYDAPIEHFQDLDGDGFGDATSGTEGCFPNDPSWIEDGGDCADDDASSYPGAPELCDGIDHDCDGDPWEGEERVWQVDRDCDGAIDALESSCDPLDLPDLGDCDPVLHDGSDPALDCGLDDPAVTTCPDELAPDPIDAVDAGCGCDSGGSASWLGWVVLLYGVRRRRLAHAS